LRPRLPAHRRRTRIECGGRPPGGVLGGAPPATEGGVMTVSPDLDNRFREAAAAAGLIDAAFDLADTPIGTLFVAATDRGLCQISFETDRGLDALSRARGPPG